MKHCRCGEHLTGGFGFDQSGQLVQRPARDAVIFSFTREDAELLRGRRPTHHDVRGKSGALLSHGVHGLQVETPVAA